MPRGVYARKSAQQKTVGKGKAKVKAKAAPKPSAKPKSQAKPAARPAFAAPAQPKLAAVLTKPAAALAQPAAQPEPQFSAQDFRKPIDDMGGPMLRAYARSIGILERDVAALSEDRLRQNCKARVFDALED